MSITVTNKSVTFGEVPPDDGLHCAHCGEVCAQETVRAGEAVFCCEGCKMVYEILHTNDLAQYYDIEKAPGISLKAQKRERYAWLDDPEIAAKLIDFQNEEVTRVTFLLPQIHCASCIWLLENLYKLNPGVLQSRVNFLKKEAYLTFDHQKLSLRQLVELLALIGYAPAINLSDLDEKPPRDQIDRSFFYQLGVAGFAFGNIMLLSFPEYLGLTEVAFRQWFGYMNIALALPVVFYSGRHYLHSAWQGLQRGELNIDVPVALGMLTLFGRSVFEILTHTGAGYLDSLAGLVFFLLAGRWFQQKTYYRLSFERDYKSYFPIAATLKTPEGEVSVALNKLKPGDTVVVRHQELIPADGLLVKGKARIDYSFVTGESEPVRVAPGGKIFAGGRQTADHIELTLTKKVSQSYLTQLWNEDTFQKNAEPEASRLANTIGKYFTFAILTIALATLAYWLWTDSRVAFNAFTAVLIIACPCAVALSIPFTFGNAIRLWAPFGFYVKNTRVVEELAGIDAVVFDKTGTITNAGKSEIRYVGTALTPAEKAAVRSVAHASSHPVSRLIDGFFSNAEYVEVSDFEEITGQGVRGNAGGMHIQIGSEKMAQPPSENADPGDAFRAGRIGTRLWVNGREVGRFLTQNHYRRGFEKVVEAWKNRFPVYLLSGDNDHERPILEPLLGKDHLFFGQSPKDKLEFIRRLQETGKKVLMLGDGLNDAGALRQSDVGIVVSENTNNFTPACDAILDARYFDYLARFHDFARANLRWVYASYGLAFVYNVVGLSFAVQGALSPVVAAILMPLSSISIVIFGVAGSTFWAKKILKDKP